MTCSCHRCPPGAAPRPSVIVRSHACSGPALLRLLGPRMFGADWALLWDSGRQDVHPAPVSAEGEVCLLLC